MTTLKLMGFLMYIYYINTTFILQFQTHSVYVTKGESTKFSCPILIKSKISLI